MREIVDILPPYKGQRKLIADRQLTTDIIKEISRVHDQEKKNYDKIAKHFWKGDALSTARGLFDFLKENVKYKIEPGTVQTVKTPSAILNEGYGDCKHYASFTCGVVDALRRQGYPISGAYAYVNGVDDSNNYHHVFALVRDDKDKKTYWVDPIDNKLFNERRDQYKRHKIVDMALYSVSGDDAMKQAQEFVNQHLAKVKAASKEKATKAEKKQARQENKAARKANKAARKEERKKIKAMPRPQRREYRKAKRQENRAVRKSATGVQKTAHIAMKVPNAVSRNAFLGLLKINAFHMASKMADKAAKDPAWVNDLKKAWFTAGGQWTKLRQAINQGVKVYNVKFKQNIPAISGPAGYVELPKSYLFPWQAPLCNCATYDELETMAEVSGRRMGDSGAVSGPVAIAALVAAAMPLILKLLGLLRRSGVDTDEVQEGGADATEEVLDEYNDAQEYPLDEDDPDGGTYGRSDAPQFGIKAYNDPGDGTATIEYTKTNLDDNGDVRYSDSGLNATLDTIKFWVEDNKTALLWAGGGLLAIMYGPRLLDSVMSKRKRRR